MIIRRVTPRTRFSLCAATGLLLLTAWGVSTPRQVDAQGLFKGVEQGAREGNKAAGPVGGVLGGAIGGVVGVVTGVTGVITGNGGQQTTQPGAPAEGNKVKPSKAAKTSKSAKAAPMLTQQGVPVLTAEQIVANGDTNVERLKKGLDLTAEQEK